MIALIAIMLVFTVLGCFYDALYTADEQWEIAKPFGIAFLFGGAWLFLKFFIA